MIINPKNKSRPSIPTQDLYKDKLRQSNTKPTYVEPDSMDIEDQRFRTPEKRAEDIFDKIFSISNQKKEQADNIHILLKLRKSY